MRFGQALKLDTIVKGDAPTSLATTGLFKRTVGQAEEREEEEEEKKKER